eukprot:12477726-Prorocentrum_lima.AAC.1
MQRSEDPHIRLALDDNMLPATRWRQHTQATRSSSYHPKRFNPARWERQLETVYGAPVSADPAAA